MPSYLSRVMASSHPATPEKWLVDYFRGSTSATGLHVDADVAQSFGAVFSGIRLIAESIAGMPLHLYETDSRGNRTKVKDDPLFRVLHWQMHPLLSAFEGWEMLVGHLVARGNLFAQKVYNQFGELLYLVPLHPGRMTVAYPPELDGKWVYVYQPRVGPTRYFSPDELFRVLAFSVDGIFGRSMFEVAREAVAVGLAAEEYAGEFFKNDASPGGVLKHPARLGDEAYKRLKSDWNADHSGSGQHGRFAILEEGLEWVSVGMNLKDAQFIETRKFQVTEIARVMRIPPHKLMDLERATFSNIEHQSLEFVRDSLLPWAVRIEQAIWRDLFTPAQQDQWFAKFNFAGQLRGDLKSRYDAYAVGRQWGWLNANEIREMEDMNAIEGDAGDEYWQPVNMALPDTQLNPSPSDPSRQQLQPDPAQGRRALPKPKDPAALVAGQQAMLASLLEDPLRRAGRREAQVTLDASRKRGASGAIEALAEHQEFLERAVLAVAGPACQGLALLFEHQVPSAVVVRAVELWVQGALEARSDRWRQATAIPADWGPLALSADDPGRISAGAAALAAHLVETIRSMPVPSFAA